MNIHEFTDLVPFPRCNTNFFRESFLEQVLLLFSCAFEGAGGKGGKEGKFGYSSETDWSGVYDIDRDGIVECRWPNEVARRIASRDF